MHKQFMKAALEQAALGRGVCAPNPCVGAVAVSNNTIIASAWHQGAGKAHAEQRVLEQLPPNKTDITLYVTLEPCNHWGKTPPCVSAIINAGISRVIYGYRDPNPLVKANNTPQILQENGVDVLHFPLPEIDAFYQSYQFWTATGRPWVTAKLAHSLDGKIAGVDGKRVQLSNELCAQFTHQQRLSSDIIITTARTIINDDPLFTARLENSERKKTIAIVDRCLSLPSDARIFTSADHCHIYHDERLAVQNPGDNCSYHPLPVTQGHLDLKALLEHLGRLGFHDAWVEAGGTFFSALHEQELVQRTYLYIVPMILGPDTTPAYHGANFFSGPHTISWHSQANNMIACVEWLKEEVVC